MKPQGHEENNCTQTAPTFPRDQPALLVVHAAWLVPARTPLLKPGIIFGWLQSKAEVCFNLSRRVEPSRPPPEGICSNTNLKQLFPCSHFVLRVKLGARCLATMQMFAWCNALVYLEMEEEAESSTPSIPEAQELCPHPPV